MSLAGGETATARRLLLATGLADELPQVEGLARLWGRGAYHCPYCHGWEPGTSRSPCSAATTRPRTWR